MRKPRLLDLFCKAGGAARGYVDAGFDVVGADLEPQPRYPYAFLKIDVFDIDPRLLADFDGIHASPVCQGYSDLRHARGAKEHPLLISPTRAMLERTGKPYIIENVRAAAWDMRNPIKLSGDMFGLGAQGCRLLRERCFETNFPLGPLPARAITNAPVIGIYGGHARRRSAKAGGRGTRDVWDGGHQAAASEAMGIDWMTLGELSEAIPPAYTRWLGERLMAHLTA